jgi:hypothetical protein
LRTLSRAKSISSVPSVGAGIEATDAVGDPLERRQHGGLLRLKQCSARLGPARRRADDERRTTCGL